MCELWKKPAIFKKKDKTELNTEEVKNVIDDYAYIGASGLGFTGGEPLLRDDIYELIVYAKKKRLITHISSNGMIVNEKIAQKLLDSGLDAIGFSLDGATEKTHDSIRGINGSYKKVMEAISIFNNLNKQNKKKIIIVVVTLVSAINIEEILDIVSLLKQRHVDKISFIPFHDIGILGDGKPNMSKHEIKKEDIHKLDRIIDELLKIKKQEPIIDSSENYLRLFKHCFRGKSLPVTCYAGYATMSIDPYGYMYPCFPMLEIGATNKTVNVRDMQLREYWKSNELQEIRDSLKDCRKCFWNNQTEVNLLFKAGKVKEP